jgi:hypothetical protein
MNTAPNFNEDLLHGQSAEDYILTIVRRKYPKAYRAEGYEPKYDIMIPEIQKTIEVKYDLKSATTGNVAIEYRYNGKLSGLSTSEADWWALVYVIDGSVCHHFIDTNRLRAYLKQGVYERAVGGDYNGSSIILLPVIEIELIRGGII